MLVFTAGLVTALATGIGAIPFFFMKDISDPVKVGLWGLASGIMIAASVFGLIFEGLQEGTVFQLGIGLLIGIILVEVSDRFIHQYDIDPGDYEEADFKKLVLILGILTVHSFPEGVAVGVAFADLNLGTGMSFLGFTIPLLAVFMTIAISVHNIPEGIAIAIPLRTMDVREWRMVGWAIFSSLPQPIGAVLAFYFVRIARDFLPIGFGFAAGAMIYLVLTEFLPEGLDHGATLEGNGHKELVYGVTLGVVLMLPFAVI